MSNLLLICKHDVNSTKCGDDLAIGYTSPMSKKHATRTIRFRLICLNPPAGHFGLQDKNRDIIPGEILADNQLAFSFELTVKQTKEGKPNFTGKFAHGTVKERFLYLTLKAQNSDDSWRIVQRIKVHLKSITREQIEILLANPSAYLEAQVEGQRTGSVPLLDDGWVVKNLD